MKLFSININFIVKARDKILAIKNELETEKEHVQENSSSVDPVSSTYQNAYEALLSVATESCEYAHDEGDNASQLQVDKVASCDISKQRCVIC